MSDNAAVTRALNAARARTCFDPSVRSPDRLGSRAPLQAHFWIGKDSAHLTDPLRHEYRCRNHQHPPDEPARLEFP